MGLHLVLCDDAPSEIEYLRQLLEAWIQARRCQARVSAYDSAEALLFAFDADKSADILLLDIQMKGMDGVTLAKRLRETDRRVQIVFITGYPDFMAEGYEVSALHYLLKPVDPAKLWEVLDRARARLAEAPRSVLLPLHEGNLRIAVDDILYAEAFSHAIELRTAQGTHALRISMHALEKLLGAGFFRCHRSYLVNLGQIRQVTRTALRLEGGVELPLARQRYDAANRAFIDHHPGGDL